MGKIEGGSSSFSELEAAKTEFEAAGDMEGYDQMLRSLSKVAAQDPGVPFCADEMYKIMRDL